MKQKLIYIFILLLVFSFCFLQYAGQANSSGAWKDFPINVYIKQNPKSSIAQRAFNQWQTDSGMNLFKYAQNEENADLIFEYKPSNASAKHTACRQGHTHSKLYQTVSSTGQKSDVYIKSSYSYVLLKNCYSGRDADDELLFLMSMHEIGHALGLNHSTNKADIMYPVIQTVKGKCPVLNTTNDVKLLKKLYRQK